MKGERVRLRACRPFRNLVFSACCALVGGWVWDLPVPVGAVASAQPEVRASVPGEVAVSRDATVLARRILHRQGEELLVDERRLDRLAREIGSVLRLIRKRYPAMAEIAARPPTGLRLEIKGALHDDIAARWAGVSVGAVVNAGAVPPTEHAAFDALNARLGLRTVEFWPASGAICLRFADRANLRAAVEAYAAIAGVADARLVRRSARPTPHRRIRHCHAQDQRKLACRHAQSVGRLSVRVHSRGNAFFRRRWRPRRTDRREDRKRDAGVPDDRRAREARMVTAPV